METTDAEWISTREAALLLGCAERTVLLYLQRGALTGRKVGKAWLLARASVAQHGSANKARAAGSAAPPAAPAAPVAAAAPTVTPPRPARLPARRRPSGSPPGEDEDAAVAHKGISFLDLRILHNLADLAVACGRALRSLGDALPPHLAEEALHAALRCAQYGAAGYHAFLASDKLRLYAQAREQVAACAAALWIGAHLAEGQGEGLRLLAASYEGSASGIGGLMRKVGRHAE